MIDTGDIVIVMLGAIIVSGLMLAVGTWRDKRYWELMAFCEEIVNKNDAQLDLIREQVQIIVRQNDEIKALRVTP